MERKLVFKALVGSHNYNLNTVDSDKDYKVFVLPTFEDLYYNKQYSQNIIGEKEDLDIHDIRKIVNLFWKSNVNFIEVLYSTEIEVSDDDRIKHYVEILLNMRYSIVTMNLPYLYKACKGMYFNKIKYLDKGTEGTKHLVEKYRYDTKQALHAYRILDFIVRFAKNEFSSFRQAMTYNDNEREFMLSIKDGKYNKVKYLKLIEDKMKEFESLEELYSKQLFRENTKEDLENLVFNLVKNCIFN